MKKLAAALSFGLVAGIASASTIQIQTGAYTGDGSFASALDYQAAVDAAVSGPGATSTFVGSYDNLPVSLNSSALEATIDFTASTAGTWEFRTGVDFGLGGAIFLDGVALAYNTNNMWWGGSYSDPSQFLAGTSTLASGNHTLTIYGIEDCCSGNQQAQYKIGDGDFTSFSNADGLVAVVPEAQTFAMLLAGLGLVATMARRRTNRQA
jgi:hypothetical protein